MPEDEPALLVALKRFPLASVPLAGHLELVDYLRARSDLRHEAGAYGALTAVAIALLAVAPLLFSALLILAALASSLKFARTVNQLCSQRKPSRDVSRDTDSETALFQDTLRQKMLRWNRDVEAWNRELSSWRSLDEEWRSYHAEMLNGNPEWTPYKLAIRGQAVRDRRDDLERKYRVLRRRRSEIARRLASLEEMRSRNRHKIS